MSREYALNLDQLKTLPENFKPVRLWFLLAYDSTKRIVVRDFSRISFKL